MSSDKNVQAPEWFHRAIATPSEDRFVKVEGCRIHYLRWGQAGKPGILLIHGGFAHAHWWDFIAPAFIEQHCVAAMDLSGMGDSGHRPLYTNDLFAREAMGVIADAGFAHRPIVVGHSFGGFVALKTGTFCGKELGGVALVDFPVRPPEMQREHDARRWPSRPKGIYPDLPTAMKRFKLIPPQSCENGFILDYIARHSLVKVAGGWSWKFDDKVFDGLRLGKVFEDAAKVDCRLAAVYGEQSALFPREVVDYMSSALAKKTLLDVIPNAHHHLFLDQPLAFIDWLKRLLTKWNHPEPGETAS